MDVPVPGLHLSFALRVDLGPPVEMGQGRAGRRRIIPIVGGRATGPEITGDILNIGADWQTVFDDGAAHLDTRYALRTDDGAVIEIVNIGARHGPPGVMARLAAGEAVDAGEYCMRTAARLETGDPRYAWVNHTIFVSAGIRHAAAVEIHMYRVT